MWMYISLVHNSIVVRLIWFSSECMATIRFYFSVVDVFIWWNTISSGVCIVFIHDTVTAMASAEHININLHCPKIYNRIHTFGILSLTPLLLILLRVVFSLLFSSLVMLNAHGEILFYAHNEHEICVFLFIHKYIQMVAALPQNISSTRKAYTKQLKRCRIYMYIVYVRQIHRKTRQRTTKYSGTISANYSAWIAINKKIRAKIWNK